MTFGELKIGDTFTYCGRIYRVAEWLDGRYAQRITNPNVRELLADDTEVGPDPYAEYECEETNH